MNYTDIDDSIIAIVSGKENSTVDIIRISGSNSFKIFKKITKSSINPKSNQIKKYNIYSIDGMSQLDVGLISSFGRPNTLTGEDIIEINCHGGGYISSKIIKNICDHKYARHALPGEFSFRAYINNKITLIEAESINDLINSNTSIYHNKSLENIDGRLSMGLNKIKLLIVNQLKLLEHELDFNELEINTSSSGDILKVIIKIKSEINKLLKSYHFSKITRSGLRIMILGKPNAGKSSLYNYILGNNRSIVSNIPGTTRDTIESLIEINGYKVTIIDTAGYWESLNPIDQIGITRTLKEIGRADIVMIIAEKVCDFICFNKLIKGKNAIKILSKNDLYKHNKKYLSVSVKNGAGLNKLLTLISTHINLSTGKGSSKNEYFINDRHKSILNECINVLDKLINELKANVTSDIIAELLHELLEIFNEIINPIDRNKIINEIFSDFCVGK